MINELKVKKHCDKNGFTCQCFADTAIITTGLDLWKLEFYNIYNKDEAIYKPVIKVKHQNKIGNKTRKNHFHTQKIAYDIDYIFNNIIIPHEQGNRVYQKAFIIKGILASHI